MSLYKKSLELISELAKTECGDNCKTINNKNAKIEFDTVMASIQNVANSEFKYVPEAVNVQVTKAGYLVEMDDLAKFMIGADIRNFSEALDLVAEGNGVEKGSIGICIDEDAVEVSMNEAVKGKNKGVCKKCGKPKEKCECGSYEEGTEFEDTMNIIKVCQEQGIKLFKRSSKINF